MTQPMTQPVPPPVTPVMSPATRHVSFDLDGTLVNSFDVMRHAWEGATARLGIRCGFERYRRHVGLPFGRILHNIGLSDYEAELTGLYFAATRANQHRIAVVEGAAATLAAARARGFGTSVITSKPRRNAEPLLEQLQLDVDMLICADDVDRGKPDPMSATLLCTRLGLSPAEVLYVGDMVFDLQFALNSGLQFVFFTNDGHNALPANLRNPVRRIRTLSEIFSDPRPLPG